MSQLRMGLTILFNVYQGLLLQGSNGWGMQLTTDLQLVLHLRVRSARCAFPRMPF